MSDARDTEAFFTLHAGLPREGPGETADVAWAAEVAGLARDAHVLDAACGPGGDIGALLRAGPEGHVTAIDLHGPFIDDARLRWGADRRVTLRVGDMTAPEGPFDLIWCAGAVYFLGIEAALAAWRPRLSPGYEVHASFLLGLIASDSFRKSGGDHGFEPGRFRRSAAGKRGVDLLARLVSHGARGVRVRRLGGDRAGEIRFTRFLRNPSVTLDEMTGAAFERTQAACAGRDVLAVQDTTVTRSAGGGGSFLHAMIAVDAASGAVLGALDARFMERTEGGKASRRSRGFEDRQSVRWLAAARKAGELTGAARVTVVADREADMFELFAHRPDHVHLLVRAVHDRVLIGGGKLAAEIAAGPRLGYAALDLPARPGRAARTARLSVRFGRLDLRPPRENRKTCREAVPMVYVDLCEETPPEGETPLHWRLLTTLEVETVADALDVAARYARRWKIEELFRTMKRKGFDIESLRIRDAAPRNRLVLACFVAATVVMQMTAERDGPALRPLTDAFDPEERPLLEALCRDLEGGTERQKNPHPPGSLAFATWVCARLGGWTGYYGKPGPIVILRGWTEFQTLKHGAALGQAVTKAAGHDV